MGVIRAAHLLVVDFQKVEPTLSSSLTVRRLFVHVLQKELDGSRLAGGRTEAFADF
jgi:hypothetical protein